MRFKTLILLCLMLSSALVTGQDRTPEQRDWDWLAAHYLKALEMLMPVERHDGADVIYRQHDSDGDVPEQYVTIRSTPATEILEATLTRPVGATIYWQLIGMHIADRDASHESLVARITVQRQQLTSTACPALRPRLDALWKVKPSLPTRDVLVLHPVIRRFVVDLPSGRIDASLYEDDHPLVRWGQTTFDALIRCSTSLDKGQ